MQKKRIHRVGTVEVITGTPGVTTERGLVESTTSWARYTTWGETTTTPLPTFSFPAMATLPVWESTVEASAMGAANEAPETATSTERVERVDTLPLILYWLQKMHVQPIVDATWKAHPNWRGLSYGQLAVLFLAYVLHTRLHRLSGMEDWVTKHHTVLTQTTGWEMGPKDATDDRLGSLLGTLGGDRVSSTDFQRRLGRHLIYAYALPTDVGRYDTTTFSVHHALPADDTALVQRGHSKDRRPELGQFKQGLATLDPAGIPIFTNTLAGNAADDPQYVPAWREMAQTIGHTEFLYITDCKGAAIAIRATVDHEGGYYLLPLPMTGNVPERLCQWVLDPPIEPEPLYLEDVLDDEGNPRRVGQGFVVTREMCVEPEDGTQHTWSERWLVTQSTAHAHRQQKSLRQRLERAEARLERMRAKKDESVTDFQARAATVLQRYGVTDFLSVTATETITQRKKYLRRGRPTPDSPFEMVETRRLHLRVQREEAVLERALQLTGWRIYVTNVPAARMTLHRAIAYYRDQWLVERGFHRWKKGGLPALPLFVRLPERIRGLMLLMLVALQAMTLMEFVSRRELTARRETIAGLVPGLPKAKTAHPTAERLLAQFSNLHLLVEETETQVTGRLVEMLTPLQCHILALLDIPETVYDLAFSQPVSKPKFHDST